MAKLTDKQQAFVQEYLIDLNATQASIRAGYSKKTAEQQGPRLLGNVGVAEAISKAKEARAKRTEITADRVLQELAKLAFSNMEDYVNVGTDGMASVDLSDLTRDQMAAIGEVVVDTRKLDGEGSVDRVRFKLADKGINLERLGRHLKLFTDKTETNTNVNINIGKEDSGLL